MKNNKIVVIFIVMLIGIFPLLISGEVQKPVAQFVFTKSAYQLGEPIEVNEASYSPTGLKITKKEWKTTINGKERTSSYVKSLMTLKERFYITLAAMLFFFFFLPFLSFFFCCLNPFFPLVFVLFL